MYWPTGTATRLAHPSSSTPLVALATSGPSPHAPLGLTATATPTELIVWSPRPRIILASLVRRRACLLRHGPTTLLRWRPGQADPLLVLAASLLPLIPLAAPARADPAAPAPDRQRRHPRLPAPGPPRPGLRPARRPGRLLPAHRPRRPHRPARTRPLLSRRDRAPPPPLLVRPPLSCAGPICTDRPRPSSLHLSPDHILLSLAGPTPQLCAIPWTALSVPGPSARLADQAWLVDKAVSLRSITHDPALDLYVLVASDGRAYVAQMMAARSPPGWAGRCFHDPEARPGRRPATGACALNFRFGLVALAVQGDAVDVYSLAPPAQPPVYSHSLAPQTPDPAGGAVASCAWTSDGHALAIAGPAGFAVWSVYGRLLVASGSAGLAPEPAPTGVPFEDGFMHACQDLFWGPGNFELVLLAAPRAGADAQVFVVPFAKSADNTRHGFLQLDDRVSVYRGTEAAEGAMLDPGADLWQDIKIPADYISANWPIELSCISADAGLLAVAGRRGFTTFSAASGRWKLFEHEHEEQRIRVHGGMQWFGSLLVVAIDQAGAYSIRLFARENSLTLAHALAEHALAHPVVLLSIHDSSVLVYTAANALEHLIIKDGRLVSCGRVGLAAAVADPLQARGLGWRVPDAQHCFGEPETDLAHATIVLLVGGALLLLRPRPAALAYDVHTLATRVEFFSPGTPGPASVLPAALEPSLWAWDAAAVRVWLGFPDALSAGPPAPSLAFPLAFYPLAVLLHKGLVVGVQQRTRIKPALAFALFSLVTHTELFIQHVVAACLRRDRMDEAVQVGTCYASLAYFGHALEKLLHGAIEAAASQRPRPTDGEERADDGAGEEMARVARFLDHFAPALQVVAGCARKIDVSLWPRLFGAVGPPRRLFESALAQDRLSVAAAFLLLLPHYSPADDGLDEGSADSLAADAQRLLASAVAATNWPVHLPLFPSLPASPADPPVSGQLCKELMRFLAALDASGARLRRALAVAGIRTAAAPPGGSL
ncbi:hypothetical protein PtB15_5B738 [Puccinia triticina]|nr:hypothetical protein PtB15_5B738 [Puccinia triticina]